MILQLAKARERDLRIADLIDDKTLLRLQTMTTDEVEELTAMELSSLIRTSADLKSRLGGFRERRRLTASRQTCRYPGSSFR